MLIQRAAPTMHAIDVDRKTFHYMMRHGANFEIVFQVSPDGRSFKDFGPVFYRGPYNPDLRVPTREDVVAVCSPSGMPIGRWVARGNV